MKRARQEPYPAEVPERRYRICLAALTAFFAAILAMWAVLTPGFRSPDEPQHLNSVLRIVDGGGWPAPGAAQIVDGIHVAADEAGWVPAEAPLIRQESSALPRGTIRSGEPFVTIDPGSLPDRSVILDVPPSERLGPTVDQMTQHPPGYYAAAAAVLAALGGEDWRWDQQLLALRLLSAFLVVWVLPLTAGTVRNIGGSPAAALVAAATVLAVPQVGHIGASVTNDAMLLLTGAAVTWGVSRALTRPHRWPLLVGVGAALGAALLTKGFMLAAIPVVALAFVAARDAGSRALVRWRDAVLALAVAFAVGGWWWARNLLVHGTLQPSGLPPREYLTGVPDPDFGQYSTIATQSLLDSFWGNFGWLEMPWPRGLSVAGTVVVAAGVLLALSLHRGRRRELAVLLLLPALTLAVLLVNGWDSYAQVGYVAGMQGRYLFGALVPLAAAVGVGVVAASARLPRPAGLALRLGIALGSVAYGLYGLLFAFEGFYRPVGDTLAQALGRWEAWLLLDRTGLALVHVLLAAGAVAALLALVVGLWRPGGARRAAPQVQGRA